MDDYGVGIECPSFRRRSIPTHNPLLLIDPCKLCVHRAMVILPQRHLIPILCMWHPKRIVNLHHVPHAGAQEGANDTALLFWAAVVVVEDAKQDDGVDADLDVLRIVHKERVGGGALEGSHFGLVAVVCVYVFVFVCLCVRCICMCDGG